LTLATLNGAIIVAHLEGMGKHNAVACCKDDQHWVAAKEGMAAHAVPTPPPAVASVHSRSGARQHHEAESATPVIHKKGMCTAATLKQRTQAKDSKKADAHGSLPSPVLAYSPAAPTAEGGKKPWVRQAGEHQ
jgi:hypothetical protein